MSSPPYMLSVKNLPNVLEAIRTAGVPDRFTHGFLKQLGFASSTDRAVISVMRALRFLDDSSVPTDRYKRYRDTSLSRVVMAEALRDAYSDLFTINESANTMSSPELKGAFKRISGKGDSTAEKMASTFGTLAKLADWSSSGAVAAAALPKVDPDNDVEDERAAGGLRGPTAPEAAVESANYTPVLRHDIHIHLPPGQDVKTYDAIFRSLRDHFG